jgi:thiol:disulfide interchange protein
VVARLSIMLGLGLAGALVWLSAQSKPDHVTFLRFDLPLVAKAMSSKKPVMVYVMSSKDAACQALENGAFTDARVVAALEPFARFKLDLTADTSGAEQMFAITETGSVPSFTFLDSAGHTVSNVVAPKSADDLIAAATKAARR